MYARIRYIEKSAIWNTYLQILSKEQQIAIGKYIHWEDRCRTLFGKILIKYLLEYFGFDSSEIKHINHDTYGRPYLDLPLDFNISHSGSFVICAASQDCRLGIDIEEWKDINFKEFKNIFTNLEWGTMQKTQDKVPEFYNIWAQKESVIKADGRGLSRPLNKIESNQAIIKDKDIAWHLSDLKLFKGYSSWLATNHPLPTIEVEEKLL